MFLTHNDETIEYTIKYSNRKSVEIKISSNLVVALKGPKMPERAYVDILIKRWDWIQDKLNVMKVASDGLQARNYISGETFTILGQIYVLKVIRHDNRRMDIKLLDNEMVMYIPKQAGLEECQNLVYHLVQKVLKSHLLNRINAYQGHFKRKVNKVSIRDQKTRWGSCSSAGNLNFNYRLAFAPLEVIDYIVVHEMCHLEHMNHSKSFWKKVYEVMPDYKGQEAWLKYNGHKLSLVHQEA